VVEISMRWKSWYGNERLAIDLPDSWSVKRFSMPPLPSMADGELKEAIANPIGTKPLHEEVRGAKTVCIAVDDITKPTEPFKTAPLVVNELIRGGIKKEDIYFIVSLGCHRAMALIDLKKKLGEEIVRNFKIYNHNPYQNNRYIGDTKKGTRLYINERFLEADYKIGVGMLMPHNLAGFSGGGKIVLPGLASIETIEENHRPTLRGLQGGIGNLRDNQIREDIEEAAKKAGLNFIVNSIHNEDGETIKLFCGSPKTAYETAVGEAQKIYSCSPTYNNDIGIFNAFPRDTWFLLSLSALDVWSTRDSAKAIVKPGGTIVIINYCAEGAGEHGLHSKGMKHYVMRDEHGTFKDILADRDIIFLSPNLSQAIIRDYYRKEIRLGRCWEEVLRILKTKHNDSANVAVFPSGTLMMDGSVV